MKAGAAQGASAEVASRLEKLGIRTRLDLALHLPLRYEDETRLTRLADARPGEPVGPQAWRAKLAFKRSGHKVLFTQTAIVGSNG